MAAGKTRVVVALALLDIARQVSRALSAKAQHEKQGFGAGFRADAARLARDARRAAPREFEWGIPPWRTTPTPAERVRTWAPVAVVVVGSTIAVLLVARRIAHHDEIDDPRAVSTDSRMISAVKSSGEAIDAGVETVVEGGKAAAVGTASAVAAGSSAVKGAAVREARHQLDERVVQPVRKKAILYGSLGFVALTVYVVVLAALVQLAVIWMT